MHYTKKECEDLIQDQDICNEHIFDDASKAKKRCLYINNECNEIYKTCDDYNKVPKDQRKEEDCKIIESIDEAEPFLFKCKFDNDNNKQCIKEKKRM